MTEQEIIEQINKQFNYFCDKLFHKTSFSDYFYFCKFPINGYNDYLEILHGNITFKKEYLLQELYLNTLPNNTFFGDYPINPNEFNTWFMLPTKKICNKKNNSYSFIEYQYYKHTKKVIINFIKSLFDTENTLEHIYLIKTDDCRDGCVNMFFIGSKTTYAIHYTKG